MAPLVNPAEWKPVGVDDLEPAAWRAVRSTANTLVIAGPGAGKTELLAQRACYLLQTGLCPYPRRILAISFKRDAARNLRLRVAERCGEDLSRRFESYTFDAFAKGLLDRFRAALPQRWRPTADYQIDYSVERQMRALLDSLTTAESGLTDSEVRGIGEKNLYNEVFIGQNIPGEMADPRTTEAAAAAAVWARLLHGRAASVLNFHMIGRLAEMMLCTNPRILRALRSTYAFCFLDEFQDTTGIQYALTCAMFQGSDTVITAVGDNKQRIMTWAGALDGIFQSCQNDFGAKVERLARNYRSAPELVRIGSFLSRALDKDTEPQVSVGDGTDGRGECRVLLFPDHEKEARWVSDLITHAIHEEGLAPRDICVLTRMRPDRYTFALCEELRESGVEARIESDLQDLLAEPLTAHLLDLFKISVDARSPDAWSSIVDLMVDIRGADADEDGVKVLRELGVFSRKYKRELDTCEASCERMKELVSIGLDFIGRDAFCLIYPQYRQGTNCERVLEGFAGHMAKCRGQSSDWASTLVSFEGLESVPIMTMHKSKGLEYHTVVFVGLEDSALWNFARNAREEGCGFFVAFSRAMKRAIFTFCHRRPRERGRPPESQSRSNIGVLYELLQKAGVKPEMSQ